MKELGIYIHIPFCASKCYYCDFISFQNKESFFKDYINALIKEIKYKKNKFKNLDKYKITTIYIGGGTPSVIDENLIKKVLDTIYNLYNVSKKAEITIEVNPGTINKKKLEMYKKIGINRLSIGLQTTSDELLKEIGRIHNYSQFLDTYNLAKEVGFKNINIDLMLGLPKQSMKVLEESINTVIKLKPKHISLYSLIVEDNTKLKEMIDKGDLKLPSETMERKMYWTTKKILEENGYNQYEISNFAKKKYESKHNLNCWNQKEYIGFGLASHSYFESKRFCNIDNLKKYIDNINNNDFDKNVKILEEQNKFEMEKEYMLLSLRKIEGVNINEFKNKFVDNPIFLFSNSLQKLVKNKLIKVDGNYILLTKKGLDLANIVWEEFV